MKNLRKTSDPSKRRSHRSRSVLLCSCLLAGVLAPIHAFRPCHARFQIDRPLNPTPTRSISKPRQLSQQQKQQQLSVVLGRFPTPLLASADDDDFDDDEFDDNEYYEWQVGNVYDDIEKLSQTVQILQAEDHLQQVQRRDMLDNFAAQRRPIRHDFQKFVLGPWALALIMASTKNVRLTAMLQRGLDVQFWSTVVVAPIVWLLAKRRSPFVPMPEELERIDPEYRHFVTHLVDWEDSRSSCRDYVLSLLENWSSSVAGTALLGVSLLCTKQRHASVPLAILQLLTRFGAVASLHQFPKLLYDLRRQPRPLERHTFRMQRLTRFVLSVTPMAIASDLSKLLTLLPLREPARLSAFWTVPFFLASIGPLFHLMAVRSLFRIEKTHDISLATEFETLKNIVANPKEMDKRTKWRYRLHWREPQRLLQAIPSWIDSTTYRLFFKNTVPDKFMRDSRATIRLDVDQERRGRVAQMNRGRNPAIQNTEWKSRAMEVLAAEHQRDYDSGEFKDPLGVAIQQTFGIGLAYSFDHMTPLAEGEEPTSRRLQARTAKSAIRRVQEIYDAESAKLELAKIRDPRQRDRMKQLMQQRSESEIQYLKAALTQLVPLDDSNPIPVKIFREKKFKKISPNEFIVVEEDFEDEGDVDDLSRKLRHNMIDDSNDKVNDNENANDFVDAWEMRQQGGRSPGDVLV